MTPTPTWSNYATHDQSLYSGLWSGCVYAAAPCLGRSGSKLLDLSRCGHSGTLTNMEPADWVMSEKRMALSLDGVDERVVVGHNSTFNSASVSVSCWYWRGSSASATNGRGIVGHFSDARSWMLHIPPANDNYLYFVTTNDTNYNDSQVAKYETVMPNGTWYHAVGRLQAGSNAQLFINGDLVATAAASTASLNVATGPVEIGAFFNGFAETFFLGYVDDVRIYNRPLQRNEIKLLSRRRGIAYEPRPLRRYYGEVLTAAAGGGGGTGSTSNWRAGPFDLPKNLSGNLATG